MEHAKLSAHEISDPEVMQKFEVNVKKYSHTHTALFFQLHCKAITIVTKIQS